MLAGRLSVVELTPFLVRELPSTDPDSLWLRGGYPDGGVLDARAYPRWQEDYLALLAQRDLPTWGLPAKPQVADRFLRMVAASHGQIWNASQVGQSLGLSHPTASSYLDYLEGAFLVRRLPPFQANLGKRLAKRPRVYWRDTGLLHALHRVADREDLLARPWAGASWVGFVLEQIVGAVALAGARPDAYYFRTSDGQEIDLVLDFGRSRWAVEVKLSSEPDPRDFARLDRAADLAGAGVRVLIYQTSAPSTGPRRFSGSLRWFLERLPL